MVVTDNQKHSIIYLNASARHNFFNPETRVFASESGHILMEQLLNESGEISGEENAIIMPMENATYSIRSFPIEWDGCKATVHCIGDVTDAQEEKEQLQDMAVKDSLTAAYNRRYCE